MPTAVPTEYEVLRQLDPVLRHLAAKQHLLERTNDEREKAGVLTVDLSDNPAAQLHAEAALLGNLSRLAAQRLPYDRRTVEGFRNGIQCNCSELRGHKPSMAGKMRLKAA